MPLVSIIIPVHNAERFLAAAVDSVLGQTYKNFGGYFFNFIACFILHVPRWMQCLHLEFFHILTSLLAIYLTERTHARTPSTQHG